MKLLKYITLAAVSVLLFSCTSTKTAGTLNKVYVTNTNPVDLLPVDAIKLEIDEYQTFSGNFGGKEFNANLYLHADKEGITILILNEMGIEIGSIVYDGKSCMMESSFFPPQLKPEYIILDLQNAYCNKQKLAEHYKKYGLEYTGDNVTYSRRDGYAGNINKIEKDKKVIEVITTDFHGSYVHIENKLRGYTYTIGTAGIEF